MVHTAKKNVEGAVSSSSVGHAYGRETTPDRGDTWTALFEYLFLRQGMEKQGFEDQINGGG